MVPPRISPRHEIFTEEPLKAQMFLSGYVTLLQEERVEAPKHTSGLSAGHTVMKLSISLVFRVLTHTMGVKQTPRVL